MRGKAQHGRSRHGEVGQTRLGSAGRGAFRRVWQRKAVGVWQSKSQTGAARSALVRLGSHGGFRLGVSLPGLARLGISRQGGRGVTAFG